MRPPWNEDLSLKISSQGRCWLCSDCPLVEAWCTDFSLIVQAVLLIVIQASHCSHSDWAVRGQSLIMLQERGEYPQVSLYNYLILV